MDDMDFGVLSDMPNIRKKACSKLLKQQELQQSQLLSSYKAMVSVVVNMMNSGRAMRSFLKATSGSSLIKFSGSSENNDDMGDGGGAPVFTFLPISAFEMLAEELVEMFKQELILKRLLIVELLSVACHKSEQFSQLSWADELYCGEADDLSTCNLYAKETAVPCLPKMYDRRSGTTLDSDKHPNHEVLQVYLTTWLAAVNIDSYRVEDIFATVREEMSTSFS